MNSIPSTLNVAQILAKNSWILFWKLLVYWTCVQGLLDLESMLLKRTKNICKKNNILDYRKGRFSSSFCWNYGDNKMSRKNISTFCLFSTHDFIWKNQHKNLKWWHTSILYRIVYVFWLSNNRGLISWRYGNVIRENLRRRRSTIDGRISWRTRIKLVNIDNQSTDKRARTIDVTKKKNKKKGKI